MALKFQLQLNNLRFSVNPTGLRVNKPVSFQPISTQSGVVYQVWYDAPELLTITGASAGSTAFTELNFLKTNFDRTNKVSELFYKTRVYRGLITNMEVSHDISHINRFQYTITFQLLFGEKFAIQDFAVTTESLGVIGKNIRFIEQDINRELNKFNEKVFGGKAFPTLER